MVPSFVCVPPPWGPHIAEERDNTCRFPPHLRVLVLVDSVGGILPHTTRRPLHRARGVAGRATAAEMVKKWATLVPEDCCLVVDSYFSSHAAAEHLATRGTPFIMLAKRDAAGVGALSRGSTPHSIRVKVNVVHIRAGSIGQHVQF